MADFTFILTSSPGCPPIRCGVGDFVFVRLIPTQIAKSKDGTGRMKGNLTQVTQLNAQEWEYVVDVPSSEIALNAVINRADLDGSLSCVTGADASMLIRLEKRIDDEVTEAINREGVIDADLGALAASNAAQHNGFQATLATCAIKNVGNNFTTGQVIDGLYIGSKSSNGSSCVALGAAALNIGGPGTNQCTAVGSGSLRLNSSGDDNTASGFEALSKIDSGSRNTSLGVFAGDELISGSDNVAIGYDSGPAPSGSNLNNTIAIGSIVQPTQSNQIVIGNSACTQCVISADETKFCRPVVNTSTAQNVTINAQAGRVSFPANSGNTVKNIANSLVKVGTSVLLTPRCASGALAAPSISYTTVNGILSIIVHVSNPYTLAFDVDFLIIN